MRILLSLDRHPSTDLYKLIEQLRRAGVSAIGGANLGDLQAVINFRRPQDTDRAIVLLQKMGIEAHRG